MVLPLLKLFGGIGGSLGGAAAGATAGGSVATQIAADKSFGSIDQTGSGEDFLNLLTTSVIVDDVSVPFAASTTVQHDLGRVPLAVIVIKQDKARSVLRGSYTASSFTVQSSAEAQIASFWLF